MKTKVLIVDDQKGVCRLLQELFTMEGYEVAVAGDGREALEKFEPFEPDIVLMDMKMPHMNGLEAAQEMLKINPKVPIIMMTAYGEIEMVHKALKIGVRRHITKPFDILDLRDLVRDILAAENSGSGESA
ncbi:MAG: response regulator [Solirubrobacterales bacterium]